MLQTRKICARQHPACPAENKIVIIMKERKKKKRKREGKYWEFFRSIFVFLGRIIDLHQNRIEPVIFADATALEQRLGCAYNNRCDGWQVQRQLHPCNCEPRSIILSSQAVVVGIPLSRADWPHNQ